MSAACNIGCRPCNRVCAAVMRSPAFYSRELEAAKEAMQRGEEGAARRIEVAQNLIEYSLRQVAELRAQKLAPFDAQTFARPGIMVSTHSGNC